MKLILCVLALLCLFYSVHGQVRMGDPPLLVGDEVPEVVISNLLNCEEDFIRLSPLEERLVILHFVATTCKTSVKSVSHLQELQRAFGDAIQIIIATQQERPVITKVAEEQGWWLPVAVEDRVLGMMFPHLSVPHQVWLYNGEVKAITDWRYANTANISRLLSGEEVITYLKHEDTINISKPLLRAVANLNPLYQSVITPKIPNGSAGYKRQDHSLLIYNSSIAGLYREAFEIPAFPTWAYIIAEVSDSLHHILFGPDEGITGEYSKDEDIIRWEEEHTYCYNLVFVEGSEIPVSELKRIMRQDLNNFFSSSMGISGALEERMVRCLALEKLSEDVKLSSQGGKPSVFANSFHYSLKNKPLSLFVQNISYKNFSYPLPIVNNTGYTGNIDLEISSNLNDLERVNVSLEKYGLTLREEEIPLQVLVISEVKKTVPAQ